MTHFPKLRASSSSRCGEDGEENVMVFHRLGVLCIGGLISQSRNLC